MVNTCEICFLVGVTGSSKEKQFLLNRFRLLMSEGEFYIPSWCLDFGAAASADESHIPAEPRKT